MNQAVTFRKRGNTRVKTDQNFWLPKIRLVGEVFEELTFKVRSKLPEMIGKECMEMKWLRKNLVKCCECGYSQEVFFILYIPPGISQTPRYSEVIHCKQPT